MPPRKPGTLSNGVLSLKFMQRGLAADQKPVEAEKAQLVDDSHWEIAHPPETKALLNSERQKGLDVTYEASYIPFLYDTGLNESEDGSGPSLPPRSIVAFSGRRVFRSGQEVIPQDEPVIEPKDDLQGDHDGELRYSSLDLEEETNGEPSKPNTGRRSPAHTNAKAVLFASTSSIKGTTGASLTTQPIGGKPQFLRPADVDVATARATNANPSGQKGKMTQRDKLAAMIASAKVTTPAPVSSLPNTQPPKSTADSRERNGSSGTRRKAAEDDEEVRPRKKPKKTKGEAAA